MSTRDTKPYTILDATGTTASGLVISAKDFTHAVLSFATDGGDNANLTVKFQGSIQETSPDFSLPQSVSNHWDYIEIIDLQNGNSISGSDGITVLLTDYYRLFEANINGLEWICATVTNHVAGQVTVKVVLFN